MTRKPAVKLKLVKTEDADDATQGRRDPRSLVRLDWYSAAILCTLMVAAPLVAGDFATSSAVLPMVSTWSLFQTIGAAILLALIALTYLPFAWREWTKPVAIGAVSGLAPAFALLAVWAAFSATRTPAMYLTVNALAILCAILVSAGLISRLARDRNALLAMLVSITAGGSIVAVTGVREYISFVMLHAPQHRSFSTFSDPNFLAGYLLLTIPVAISLFASSKDVRLRYFAGLSIVIQSSALWLSGSRSGSAIVFFEIGVFLALALFVRTTAAHARWIKIGLALFVIGSLPALTPLLSRLAHSSPIKAGRREPGAGVVSADPQVNSNEFRRWTWVGTAAMARDNPIFGTGLGAFYLSYPKYEETGFTTHAHNSYLQLMAETGYPGVLLVLVGLAAAAAFAAHSLVMQRSRAAEGYREAASIRPPAEETFHPLLQAPDLLLAGLLAAVAGSMLHNLIDSDWYVVANALTLAALVALAVALARDMAPLSARRPAPLRRELIAAGAVIALLLIWRSQQLASSRMNETLGQTDIQAISSPSETQVEQTEHIKLAAEEFRAAAAADPLDPEPHLGLAEVAQFNKDPDEHVRELNAALSACKTGEAYYRLGQYYMAKREWQTACEAFEHARNLQPKMPQSLRALASAYLADAKTDDAVRTLQSIIALQHSPFGEVRAMHEAVETEFGYAHAMLGDIYADRGDWQGASTQYEQARDVLSEYWIGRHYLINDELRTDAKRKDLADLFEKVLQQLDTAYTRLNRPSDAAAAQAKLQAVRKDRESDAAKANAAGAPSAK